jgi:hypothetical protein
VRPVGGVVTASLGSAGMPGLFGLLEGCCPACLAAGALTAGRVRAQTETGTVP